MFNIHRLIDPATGEVFPYDPSLADQVAEIAKAIERDRAANVRQRLAELRRPDGETLAYEFFVAIPQPPEHDDDIPF